MAERIFASPNARRVAREAGARIEDLAPTITGTGPNGRIIGRDVEAALERPRSPVGILAGTPDRIRLWPERTSLPAVSVRSTLQVRRLLKLRDRLNSAGEPVRISLDALMVKAAARTQRLVRHELEPHAEQPVNVALGLPGDHAFDRVTVLRNADTMPISAVSTAIEADAAGHRWEDFEDVEVTVLDLGGLGAEEFEPTLQRWGTALGIGAVHEEPVVRKGKVKAAPVVRASLVGDPESDDVPMLARWMRTFESLIRDPVRILI